MRIQFNRYRFRAEVEALFMKAGRGSRGIGRYVKGTYMDRIVWSLKGWGMRFLTDSREERGHSDKKKSKKQRPKN